MCSRASAGRNGCDLTCALIRRHPSPGTDSHLMRSRSANPPIKGYFYQFDHTIVQLLSAISMGAVVLVEGIDDIDFEDGNEGAFIQCKYYEGTSYNHSNIKAAVIQMVRHFHSNGCRASQTQKYRVYGHYKGGQDKLPLNRDIDFLKKHFLTYSANGKTHEVHVELALSDDHLKYFLNLLEIDVLGESYDGQQGEVEKLLMSQVPNCEKEDVLAFYYPIAIHTIQKLAIQKDPSNRRITKSQFINEICKKDIVFSSWLRRKFGDAYYARSIKRKYFSFRGLKIPKAARIFIVDATGEFNVAELSALLSEVGRKFSHVEHRTTPNQDRFCPYVLLRGLMRSELIQLKEHLFRSGTKFFDGHAFDGASFSPQSLTAPPTKDNLIRLKFITHPKHLEEVISSIKGTKVEIFEFFKDEPIKNSLVKSSVLHHKIKTKSVFIVSEVI